MTLIVAEDVYGQGALACARYMEGQQRAAGEPPVPAVEPQGIDAKTVAYAYVSWGRWVGDCPGPGCHAAQILSRSDRRYFCPLCRNAYIDGTYARVVWPKTSELARIEQLLAERALPENRNWTPGETTDTLLAENMVHIDGYKPKRKRRK